MVSLEAERVRQRGQCTAADCSVLIEPRVRRVTAARWVDDQTQKAEKHHYSLRGLK